MYIQYSKEFELTISRFNILCSDNFVNFRLSLEHEISLYEITACISLCTLYLGINITLIVYISAIMVFKEKTVYRPEPGVFTVYADLSNSLGTNQIPNVMSHVIQLSCLRLEPLLLYLIRMFYSLSKLLKNRRDLEHYNTPTPDTI